ncbi:uncharacterized protein VTP21DRAFT_6871 [Calcarisporiella thermophila]|uniref:uncharacterized protein n=1 Tax=Calcarisporiella thermophila TaxID=911321 RepID=UPI0037448218
MGNREEIQDLIAKIDPLHTEFNVLLPKEAEYYNASCEFRVIEEERAQPLRKAVSEAEMKTKLWKLKQQDLQRWSLVWFFAWIMCDWKRQWEESERGLKKAQKRENDERDNLAAVEEVLQARKDKMDQISNDFDRLESIRNEAHIKLEQVFTKLSLEDGKSSALKDEMDRLREQIQALTTENTKIERVVELLTTADNAILEAILDHRSKTGGGARDGGILFPDEAYYSILDARKLLPELPAIPKPEYYKEKPDETGNYYTVLQSYLWDVHENGVKMLIRWCHDEKLRNYQRAAKLRIELGRTMCSLLNTRYEILRGQTEAH